MPRGYDKFNVSPDIAAALETNAQEVKAAISQMNELDNALDERQQRDRDEERRFLQGLLTRFRDAEQRARNPRRKLRPSERAMMLAEYQRDIETIKRLLKHYV